VNTTAASHLEIRIKALASLPETPVRNFVSNECTVPLTQNPQPSQDSLGLALELQLDIEIMKSFLMPKSLMMKRPR
jgi:hypothetical protein